MTREQARQEINSRISELPKAKQRIGGYDTYICPFCENGKGKDGDGICTYDGGIHWKCFKCGESGDYLNFLKKLRGETEQQVFNHYGLTIDDNTSLPTDPAATCCHLWLSRSG